MPKKNSSITLLFTPSLSSGCVSFLIALGLLGVPVLAVLTNKLGLEQGVYAVHDASSISYQQVTNNLAKNDLTNNLLILLLYAGAGLAVYLIAATVYNSVNKSYKVTEALHYIHINQGSLIRYLILKLLAQLATVAVWAVYIVGSIKFFVPYVLYSAHQLALDSPANAGLQATTLLAATIVAVHIHVIFARLLVLRPRLFSSF